MMSRNGSMRNRSRLRDVSVKIEVFCRMLVSAVRSYFLK